MTAPRPLRLLVLGAWFLGCQAGNGVREGPGPRYGHELVFDEARRITILFGGFRPDGTLLADTWGWDGNSWRLLAPAGPPARRWAAAAYDAGREVVVLFGGREGMGGSGASLGDTWIWDGTEWREADVPGPSPRDHHRAAYDRVRDRVVIFGGWNGRESLGDTWEWDGDRWLHVSSRGPLPRSAFGMAYDEPGGEVLLMGGKDLDRTFSDTWSWDGAEWTRRNADGPGPRSFHAMAPESRDRTILLYGGRHDDRLHVDLWRWGGRGWSRLPGDGPVRRGIYASAYDPVRGGLLFHGSGDLVDGAWRLESSTWTWTDGHGWERIAGG